MPVSSARLSQLSDTERVKLESWLFEFDQSWTAEGLAAASSRASISRPAAFMRRRLWRWSRSMLSINGNVAIRL